MVRREGTPPSNSSRTKSKKKRNSSSGSGRRWPFSRKSSKSITQQGSTSGDDDILVISPGVGINGDLEFRIPDSPAITQPSVPRRSTSGSLDSESSLTRNSGVNSRARDEVIATVGVASEQGVTGTTGPSESGETVTELQQGRSEISGELCVYYNNKDYACPLILLL